MDKVKDIYDKYTALTEKLSDPEVLADMEEWTKISKERAEIEEIAQKYAACLAKEREMNDAFSEAEKETGEMKELLLEEERGTAAPVLPAEGSSPDGGTKREEKF